MVVVFLFCCFWKGNFIKTPKMGEEVQESLKERLKYVQNPYKGSQEI